MRTGLVVVYPPPPPLDFPKLARWIDRVPSLALDGAKTTPEPLKERLSGFWLPDEVILYIGKATTLRSRVRGYYNTRPMSIIGTKMYAKDKSSGSRCICTIQARNRTGEEIQTLTDRSYRTASICSAKSESHQRGSFVMLYASPATKVSRSCTCSRPLRLAKVPKLRATAEIG